MKSPNPFDPNQNPNYGPRPSFEEPKQVSPVGAILRCISDIPPQKLCWLWPGRVPLGKLTLFAGDPGLGKSFVTLDAVARVTRGRVWPDGSQNIESGSAIILSAEDDPADTIRPRLEAAGADLSEVHILEAVRHIKLSGESVLDQFSLQTDIDALQDAALLLEDVRLVVIDPISAYLGGTDSHVNSKVRGLLAPLVAMCQSLRIAIILVDHLSKSNRPALYRPNGSIAFTAAARAVWFFAKSLDDPATRLMLPGKLNLAPDQTGLSYTLCEQEPGAVCVAWGGPVSDTADSVLQPEDAEERSERLEATDWLQDQLASGPISANRIKADSNSAGLAWITVRRAKDALGVITSKDSFESGWYWRLPDHEGAHQAPKMLTSERGASSADLNTLGVPASAELAITYTLDLDGLGASCDHCEGRFRTVAGWRAHISRNRCAPRVNGTAAFGGEGF